MLYRAAVGQRASRRCDEDHQCEDTSGHSAFAVPHVIPTLAPIAKSAVGDAAAPTAVILQRSCGRNSVVVGWCWAFTSLLVTPGIVPAQ